MSQLIKQKAFSLNWENNTNLPSTKQDSYYSMRNWQTLAFEDLKDSSRVIINAPMGSGKSWMMCLLSAYKMKKDPSLRTLIVVPQTVIAAGFLEEKFQMPDGEKVDWQIKHNLCDSDTPATVKKVIKWLHSAGSSLDDRILICTHATLTHAYKKLKETNQLNLLSNLLVWIDEAHHVKNVMAQDLGVVVNNELGGFVSYLSSIENANVQLGLVTASFFRGDRYSVLTNEMQSKFTWFKLPYDEYFKTMKHLKSFSIDFLLCGANYNNAIELLIQQRRAKDIIYIPHPASQYSSKNKHKEVSAIVSSYEKIHGPQAKSSHDECLVLSKDGNAFKILDLVDESNRSKKKYFIGQPKLKHDLDAIVALGMFKEGANWIWADRSMIVGHRASLVDMLQMIGRLFRDAEGKEHVEVFQLLTFSFDQQDEESFKENLNNYLKAIFASLILENILKPIKIKVHETPKNKDSSGDQRSENTVSNWLSIAIPDEIKQLEITEDIIHHWVDIKTQNKEASRDVTQLRDLYDTLIPQMLETKYGIIEHAQEIATEVWNRLARRSLSLQGIAVEDITIELLKITDPLDCLIRYTSGVCDIKTFEQFREAIQSDRTEWRSFEDAREFIRGLKLKSETDYKRYISGYRLDLPQLPSDIPKAPWSVYFKAWISMGDYLGTNQIAPRLRVYRSYEEAEMFAHALNLSKKEDWFSYVRGKMPHLPPLPYNIPTTPDRTYNRTEYGKKWESWRTFLGIQRMSNQEKSKTWRPYIQFKCFIQSLKLKKRQEWTLYCKGKMPHLLPMPADIPKNPDQAYSDEWENWPMVLGCEPNKRNRFRDILSYKDAIVFVHALGLNTQKDWQVYCRGDYLHLPPKPLNIPSNPDKAYKNKGWLNWKNWLTKNKTEK